MFPYAHVFDYEVFMIDLVYLFQVRASAVFVPEKSDLQSEEGKYLFSYSIRMRLVSEGNILDGTYLTSCQLYSRHWIFRANGTVVSDISDKAVIGKVKSKYSLAHVS